MNGTSSCSNRDNGRALPSPAGTTRHRDGGGSRSLNRHRVWRGPILVAAVLLPQFVPPHQWNRDDVVSWLRSLSSAISWHDAVAAFERLTRILAVALGCVWFVRDLSKFFVDKLRRYVNRISDEIVLDEYIKRNDEQDDGRREDVGLFAVTALTLWGLTCAAIKSSIAASLSLIPDDTEQRVQLIQYAFKLDETQARQLLFRPGGYKNFLLPAAALNFLQGGVSGADAAASANANVNSSLNNAEATVGSSERADHDGRVVVVTRDESQYQRGSDDYCDATTSPLSAAGCRSDSIMKGVVGMTESATVNGASDIGLQYTGTDGSSCSNGSTVSNQETQRRRSGDTKTRTIPKRLQQQRQRKVAVRPPPPFSSLLTSILRSYIEKNGISVPEENSTISSLLASTVRSQLLKTMGVANKVGENPSLSNVVTGALRNRLELSGLLSDSERYWKYAKLACGASAAVLVLQLSTSRRSRQVVSTVAHAGTTLTALAVCTSTLAALVARKELGGEGQYAQALLNPQTIVLLLQECFRTSLDTAMKNLDVGSIPVSITAATASAALILQKNRLFEILHRVLGNVPAGDRMLKAIHDACNGGANFRRQIQGIAAALVLVYFYHARRRRRRQEMEAQRE